MQRGVLHCDTFKRARRSATACMLAETALGLALEKDLGPAGVITPSVALGDALIARLNPHWVRFVVDE